MSEGLQRPAAWEVNCVRNRMVTGLLVLLAGAVAPGPGGGSGPEAGPPAGGPNNSTPVRLRVVVQARNELPSSLPWKYADYLDPDSPDCILAKADLRAGGFMTWSFFGGTVDPNRTTRE